MRVLYNEQTNCLRARVEARSFTNRLHGKAAERAEITVLKLKSPSSTNLRNLPCLMAEALKTLPQLISLIRKYLFHIPYLARDNGYWHERKGS